MGLFAGEFPDNVIAQDYINRHTFSFTFDKVYNTSWLLYDELFQVIPIPQHAWDRTSASSGVGNFDLSASGAVAVYQYLQKKGSDEQTEANDPLWQIVDGPWKIAQFSAPTGYAVLRRNTEPDSPGPRPKITELALEPFTNDAAEYNALLSGSLDYGYVPTADLSQVASLKHKGFTISPEYSEAVSFLLLNLGNTSSVGPILSQLYVRQALQHLIDVPQYVKSIYHGYAQQCYGPVPCTGDTAYVQPSELHDPYPYNIATAKSVLSAHGWTVHPGGTTICTQAGVGSTDCGTGIPSGAAMTLTAIYPTGYVALQAQFEAMKSAFSQAGIQVALDAAPATQLFTVVNRCDPATGASCSWEIGDFQNPTSWNYQGYPSGELPFGCDALYNSGEYCTATNTMNINASLTASGVQPIRRYERYFEDQVPVLWVPNPPAQVSAISSHLHGVIQSPMTLLNTQSWTLSG